MTTPNCGLAATGGPRFHEVGAEIKRYGVMVATISRAFGRGKATVTSVRVVCASVAVFHYVREISWSVERAGPTVWSKETVVGVSRENDLVAPGDVSVATGGHGLLLTLSSTVTAMVAFTRCGTSRI